MIVVALAAGGILAGIIGVFLAVPVAGVISVVLQYAQDRTPPATPLSESPAALLDRREAESARQLSVVLAHCLQGP